MKKRLFLAGVLLITLLGCSNKERKAVREMEIKHIETTNLEDGKYNGEFSYGKYCYKVEVIIKDGKIANAKAVENRSTKYAKKAEVVLKKIIEEQRNDVDGVAGATTTSKALLKAVENALSAPKSSI